MTIEVLKPGMFSTFQDLGRVGSQHLGAPVCGAMDELSHRLANLAVGNAPEQATLEITLMGPALRFGRAATLAWAGADLAPLLDGKPVPRNTPTAAAAGATLQFGPCRHGVRAYLAVRGGYVLDRVMGSTSTYVRGGFGGYHGRALRKGDAVELNAVDAQPDLPPPWVTPAQRQALQALQDITWGTGGEAPIRVMPGREWTQFSDGMRQTLLAGGYRIGGQSDRMGYRLEGPVLTRSEASDILSVPVAFGTVQVPPDGQPIILMADRQSVGGYPKIVQVATVDLPRLAQRAPGEVLRFRLLDAERAQALLLARSAALKSLQNAGEHH